MMTDPTVDVTVSADLLRRLRDEARMLGVSIEWLIASMIVDTVDSLETPEPVAA